MDDIQFARARIARQKGRLHGWRPFVVGNGIAIVAVDVLGDVRSEPGKIGMRVVVAARTPPREEAVDAAVALALRKRAVLGADDLFMVERRGRWHPVAAPDDDPLTWPWHVLTFHVATERLPAIAGLATDSVYDTRTSNSA